MQTVADVLELEIKVLESEQACALGAAMFAAVAAGIHPDIPAAQAAMGSSFCRVYTPRAETRIAYNALYRRYTELGSYSETAAG
jgi:L-ribulokinase